MLQQMNNLTYTVANAAHPHNAAFGFRGEHFEVMSPPIRSRYAGVVWRVLAPVALPADIIARYNNSVMAFTGFEVDVVRKSMHGGYTPVPNYQSYNHHFTSHVQGAGVTLPANIVGKPNIRHELGFSAIDGHPDAQLVANGAAVPGVQAFSEHNGNEARQSYHGLPLGYVQPLASPTKWVFNPMQINTLNPDGSGTRGGPLPRASAAPVGARYSGLLECPCTTRIDYAKRFRGWNPGCATDPRSSDLLAHKNPTCHGSTYVGGMECCHDNDVLLDADQEQPAYVDEVYYRWRFYHEPYDTSRHVPVFHLEWAVNGCDSGGPRGNPANCRHIEYDVVRAPPGTPASMAVHSVTSHFKVKDMLSKTPCDVRADSYCADGTIAKARGDAIKLIMAGGHCHSPHCISLELFNDDTGELICRITPVRGSSDATYDEDGYLWLPPCQWSEHDPRLPPPPVLPLEANLVTIKRANSSVYHYGVMGIWQMRGAYLSV